MTVEQDGEVNQRNGDDEAGGDHPQQYDLPLPDNSQAGNKRDHRKDNCRDNADPCRIDMLRQLVPAGLTIIRQDDDDGNQGKTEQAADKGGEGV